jgi:hypothetical protein
MGSRGVKCILSTRATARPNNIPDLCAVDDVIYSPPIKHSDLPKIS